MARQHLEVNEPELITDRPEAECGKTKEGKAIKPKKYHVKISMIRPYETVDFWTRKPDAMNILELFMSELTTRNLGKYFKFEMFEAKTT